MAIYAVYSTDPGVYLMQSQPAFIKLREHLAHRIVGQQKLLDRLMIGLLTGGHVLLEGPPGLAKTTAVNALASGVHASFQRIQFTPDLMPTDLTGGEIFDSIESKFRFVAGPIFKEIILADEINRAPPKVQSALLEGMAEHQVTVNGVTRTLPELFMVMATQNPLEQTGTYPLPEAQLDRFLLHVVINYPSEEEELMILQRDRASHYGIEQSSPISPLSPTVVLLSRKEVAEVHIEESLQRYIVKLVSATRNLGVWEKKWADYIQIGASPRATLGLSRAASAYAYLQGREYVIPDDIIDIAPDILRHRIILSYNAQADGLSKDALVDGLLSKVPIP